MTDQIEIDDDEAAFHIGELTKLYKVALREADRYARGKGAVYTNLAVKRTALVGAIQAYKDVLARSDNAKHEMVGHHVMARWSREKLEEHEPGSTGDAPI